eukprot:scaffold407_cov251-Pinguiococcus_pyrenoidosus.AAC.22
MSSSGSMLLQGMSGSPQSSLRGTPRRQRHLPRKLVKAPAAPPSGMPNGCPAFETTRTCPALRKWWNALTFRNDSQTWFILPSLQPTMCGFAASYSCANAHFGADRISLRRHAVFSSSSTVGRLTCSATSAFLSSSTALSCSP